MDYKEYAKRNRIDLDSNDPIAEVSNLITEARLYAGISQAKLARKIGTQQPSIARAEKGAVVPSIEFLQKVAAAVGTYLIAPKFGFMLERDRLTQISVNFSFPTRNYGIGTIKSTHTSIKTKQLQHA